jgi:hypothetical protein
VHIVSPIQSCRVVQSQSLPVSQLHGCLSQQSAAQQLIDCIRIMVHGGICIWHALCYVTYLYLVSHTMCTIFCRIATLRQGGISVPDGLSSLELTHSPSLPFPP